MNVSSNIVVPMLDLQAEYQQLRDEIGPAVTRVMESGRFVLGPECAALESEMTDWLGVPHAITCASGTDALRLALAAADIGPGDEVITTAFTFIATASTIVASGARPVFVDIDPVSWTLDPARVADAINARTRAVLPVHLYGQPADLHSLQVLCRDAGLLLIEDCAQAFGATLRDEDGTDSTVARVGSVGTSGCFSFYPGKNLGCYGDGGMVVSGSAETADLARTLRDHGKSDRYHYDKPGFNSRLDEIQAAILRVKLDHVARSNERRREIAGYYRTLLADTPLMTPVHDVHGEHVFNQYTVLTERRNSLAGSLQSRGIASAIHYPVPLHRQAVLQGKFNNGPLPVTEDMAERCLSLPVHPYMPDAHVEFVADSIRQHL